MNSRKQQLEAFNRLLDIMDELREKCPWDKKQTLESLRHLTIEETYELADAILENDLHEIKNELGDVLLHLVFYAKIGSEKKAFDIGDVANAISEKLIARHPHIYGDVKVNNEEEVKQNWEKLKLKEDEDGNKITDVMGIRASCKIMKTRYSKPFETLQIKIPYSTGMNPYSGLVDMFEKQGLLKQSGNRLAWIDPETGEEFKFYRKEWKDDKLDMIMNKFHIKTITLLIQ